MKDIIAAYCYQSRGKEHRLVVVTSSTGRWILPKGQTETSMGNREVALDEAWEEAGVKGKITAGPIDFIVHRSGRARWRFYLIKIRRIAESWPERNWRERRIVTPRKALELIDNNSLGAAVWKIAKSVE